MCSFPSDNTQSCTNADITALIIVCCSQLAALNVWHVRGDARILAHLGRKFCASHHPDVWAIKLPVPELEFSPAPEYDGVKFKWCDFER